MEEIKEKQVVKSKSKRRNCCLLKRGLYILSLLAAAAVGFCISEYMMLRRSKPIISINDEKPADETASQTIALSRLALPNEWSVDSSGQKMKLSLTHVDNVVSNDEDTVVTLAGIVSSTDGQVPLYVKIGVDMLDTSNTSVLYVSKIISIKVPSNKSIETLINSFARTYGGHLQKTLLK